MVCPVSYLPGNFTYVLRESAETLSFNAWVW